MKLLAFRITNFRSIVDTDWCFFSNDGVTVLVGQNESGKTSVLEALRCGLTSETITDDDLRSSAPLPQVFIRCQLNTQDIDQLLEDDEWSDLQVEVARNHFRSASAPIELRLDWNRDISEGKAKYSGNVDVADPILSQKLEATWKTIETIPVPPEQTTSSQPELTSVHVGFAIYDLFPKVTLFNAETGLLPNQVDISEKFQPVGANSNAASNFLAIAGLDLKKLITVDRRERAYLLNRANDQISKDFGSFWTQTIGKSSKISIRCEIENYGLDHPEKAGKPHLVFWIGDGNAQLFPKQRSTGVRWFISFYLQLKATEKSGARRLFLMDEPGANLHPRAQSDVLGLVNRLAEHIQIVYSTHSPALLEYTKLYRVHAVQRDGEVDESPTTVIDAHRLGAASTDTLSPLLMSMGADFSSQSVIKPAHNVILEEISGYYYLNAFWALTNSKQPAHFIAATGASNIPALANMFLGWGIKFAVVVDDDSMGRNIYKDLKRDLFRDDDDIASQAMWRIKDCAGIEDVFSTADFVLHVLRDEQAEVAGKNTEYLKKAGRSKPVMAYQFWADVQSGKLKSNSLTSETMSKIQTIVTQIESRIARHT